ncbi:MAG: HAD hydrolase-like protein [Novosphingobium sp.]|nr:HAD hydrolase-like protein [Novosphingobium sp.]
MTQIPFEIVGFDLDGTLLDTEADLGAAVNHALALEGRDPVPHGETRKLIGGGGRKMLERALSLSSGVPDERFESLYRELIAYYEANIAVHTQPYPGCVAMLDGLAERDVKVAVVTNKRESLAVKLLGELGLARRFFTIIGGDTMGEGRAKPAPDQLHEMVVRGGGGRAAFVGDTTFDTLAAQAAGFPCVAVSFGFNDRPAPDLGATAVIDHYDELIATLALL